VQLDVAGGPVHRGEVGPVRVERVHHPERLQVVVQHPLPLQLELGQEERDLLLRPRGGRIEDRGDVGDDGVEALARGRHGDGHRPGLAAVRDVRRDPAVPGAEGKLLLQVHEPDGPAPAGAAKAADCVSFASNCCVQSP
jgi:hypothetical protein